jgi:hypothetical protein
MSSLRKVLSSRANGARSHGPSTPEGKQRSSQNAISHGLFARCVVLDNESRPAFNTLLRQHEDRLQPVDGMELGMVEEMVSSHWRMRRAWAMETRMLENEIVPEPHAEPEAAADAELDRMAAAFKSLAASASLALMHRYETRLHLIYQRALRNFLLLRAAVPTNPPVQNEPNPISGHSREIVLLPSGEVLP